MNRMQAHFKLKKLKTGLVIKQDRFLLTFRYK